MDSSCANAWTAIREAVKRQEDATPGTVGEQVAVLRASEIFEAVEPFLAFPKQERKIAMADPLLAVAEGNAADLREVGVLRPIAPRRMTAAWLLEELQSQVERASVRRRFHYLRDAPDVADELVRRIRERSNVRTACEFIEGLR